MKRRIATCFKPQLVGVMRHLNAHIRRLSAASHHLQMRLEWEVPPAPEWYDHHIDVQWGWDHTRSPLMVERGCFSSLAIPPGGRVLELCCGDGFNACHFYSARASEVVAIDRDPDAIAFAQRRNAAPNVRYAVGDVLTWMPDGRFDAVIWDGATMYFTPTETHALLGRIRSWMTSEGVLAGYAPFEANDDNRQDFRHEFRSRAQFQSLLMPHFRRVRILETGSSGRTNLYFYASDAGLPL